MAEIENQPQNTSKVFPNPFNELISIAKDRSRDPFWGPVILSFIGWNWEGLVALIKSDSKNYYIPLYYLSGSVEIIRPLVMGAIIFLLYPHFSELLLLISKYFRNLWEPAHLTLNDLKPVSQTEMLARWKETRSLNRKMRNLNNKIQENNTKYLSMILEIYNNQYGQKKRISIRLAADNVNFPKYTFLSSSGDGLHYEKATNYESKIEGIVVETFLNTVTENRHTVAQTAGEISLPADMFKAGKYFVIENEKIRPVSQTTEHILDQHMNIDNNSIYLVHAPHPKMNTKFYVIVPRSGKLIFPDSIGTVKLHNRIIEDI